MSPAPRVVGRYVVHAEIAAGGMATVHVGRLLGPVGFARTVAIKRLHPHFAKDPEFVAMFLDEARLAARIRHPNVVPVLDVVAEGGELFLVMEYVDGESLSRLVGASRRAGAPPPPRIAASIVAQALHGLHAAHEAKDERGEPLAIVHRDVSPQNVLVGTDGVARVLDFGVAKAIGRSSVTREGELKGKLPYMAPEQVRRGGVVTRRTDVYAAGVVLWEALAARRLFDGDGEAQVLAAVLEGASSPPSDFEPSIPKALDAIVMCALASDPDARFATARDMALAIEGATGIVASGEIGAWVSKHAANAIARRAEAIANIESAPGIPVAAPAAPAAPESAPAPPARLLDETATVPLVRAPAPRPARTVIVAVAITAAIAALGAVGALAIARSGAPEPASAPPSASTQPSTASAPVATASAPIAIASAPVATASAPEPAVTELSPEWIAAPSTKPAATHKPKAPNAGCSPPYYYEKGIKRFKPQCL